MDINLANLKLKNFSKVMKKSSQKPINIKGAFDLQEVNEILTRKMQCEFIDVSREYVTNIKPKN